MFCLPFQKTCDEVCQGQGYEGGRCAHPDSTNPNNCCDCVNTIP